MIGSRKDDSTQAMSSLRIRRAVRSCVGVMAIAAWEQWFKNGGLIQFLPDAKLIPVPATRNP